MRLKGKVYVTSDLHFNHENICGQDAFVKTRTHFKDVNKMNEYLISIHNKTVSPMGVTYMLGDFALHGKPADIFDIYNQMNGAFVIVKGNHDGSKVLNYLKKHNYKLPNGNDKFTIHDVGFSEKKNGKTYFFTHYPMEIGHSKNNLRSIHGHIHEYTANYVNMMNVGIDSPEIPEVAFGAPIPLDKVIEVLESRIDAVNMEDISPH